MAGSIAIAAAVAILAALLAGYVVGRNGRADTDEAHKRQIDAVRDAVSRVVHDVRTHPHTVDQLEREVLPLLMERQRRD